MAQFIILLLFRAILDRNTKHYVPNRNYSCPNQLNRKPVPFVSYDHKQGHKNNKLCRSIRTA